MWSLLSDVSAWAEWLPAVTSVDALDGPVLRPGARFVVRQPGLRPATWVVTTLDPPRRFVWEARSTGMRMVAEHEIDVVSSTQSRVLLQFRFSGWLGVVVGRLFGGTVQRYIEQEADALKRKLEAS
ncbi:hypothetical protein ASG87_14930 [Frateuria sp. Soil773]|nr:hypothetical protein ASG87_14930 [Frateuria sp. Soil773]